MIERAELSFSGSVSPMDTSASSPDSFDMAFLGNTGFTRRLDRAVYSHLTRLLTQREHGCVPSHFNLDFEQGSHALEILL